MKCSCLTGFVTCLGIMSLAGAGIPLSPHVTVYPGTVNSVAIEKANRRLVVYGDPAHRFDQADIVLGTHARRDVAESARALVAGGASFVVSAQEADAYAGARDFWNEFVERRFHDYAQQSTRLLAEPLRFDRTVQQGDIIAWQGISVQVVETPGTTRGAVTYVIALDGLRIGFPGDLIFGDGQLLDLHSLQDAVPEAEIRGYHGYAGRLGILIRSLETLDQMQLDRLVPAHGPVIHDPHAAIVQLIERLRHVYRNYLSINAGHWYFKDRYEQLAERALGSDRGVPWMPYAETIHAEPPAWIVPIQNSRLILSDSGSGFLVDCGSQGIVNTLKQMQRDQRLKSIEGVFITHYHDDHTDSINEVVRLFSCPVYVTHLLKDILQHPSAYRMPAMTAKPIPDLVSVADGHTLRWQEFKLTFYDFPGQTLYHDAMLVERGAGERILFAGDSFTPSGLDDYCAQNRNLLHPDQGYFDCIQRLQSLTRPCLIINQHVRETFCFSENQLQHMNAVLHQRKQLLTELFPWDDCNYGIDEQWARACPYGQHAQPGQSVTIALRVFNHAATERSYEIRLRAPAGWPDLAQKSVTLRVPSREEGSVTFAVAVPQRAAARVHVVTFDVRFASWELSHHCEAMIMVAAGK